MPASGPAERIAAGVLAALGLAWLTMLQASLGVGLLGHRVALDVVFAAGLAGLLAWRRPDLRPGRIHLGAVRRWSCPPPSCSPRRRPPAQPDPQLRQPVARGLDAPARRRRARPGRALRGHPQRLSLAVPCARGLVDPAPARRRPDRLSGDAGAGAPRGRGRHVAGLPRARPAGGRGRLGRPARRRRGRRRLAVAALAGGSHVPEGRPRRRTTATSCSRTPCRRAWGTCRRSCPARWPSRWCRWSSGRPCGPRPAGRWAGRSSPATRSAWRSCSGRTTAASPWPSSSHWRWHGARVRPLAALVSAAAVVAVWGIPLAAALPPAGRVPVDHDARARSTRPPGRPAGRARPPAAARDPRRRDPRPAPGCRQALAGRLGRRSSWP